MLPYNINSACEKIYHDLVIPCKSRFSDYDDNDDDR